MNILIVEDDFYNRMMVAHLMRNEGHTVQEVDNPEGAFEMMQRTPPHLILLDVNFGPKHLTGFQFFERIKKAGSDVPVIFMTTRSELEDKLEGFKIGADDYITKPYAPAEVAARVKSVLFRVYKRAGTDQQQRLRYDTVELDVAALQVHIVGRKPVDLTKTEMKMLMHLMQRAEQVVPRDDLLSAVWNEDFFGDSNIVDSYIRKLRRKLEVDPANPVLIRTVRGSGYKFSTKK
jgi:DNA-binding response OmpR family regulator